MRDKIITVVAMIVGFCAIAILAVWFFAGLVAPFVKSTEGPFEIVKTERVERDGDSKYMVFTDGGVYENVDSIINWKYNSSDIYAELKVGDVCTFRLSGFRIRMMSMQKNVLDYECA